MKIILIVLFTFVLSFTYAQKRVIKDSSIIKKEITIKPEKKVNKKINTIVSFYFTLSSLTLEKRQTLKLYIFKIDYIVTPSCSLQKK